MLSRYSLLVMQTLAILLLAPSIGPCFAQYTNEQLLELTELQGQASTESLIAVLADDDYVKRNAAELLLLARGKEILPELARELDGGNVKSLLTLISKLGPEAEDLLPQLVEQLGDKHYVFQVTICIEQIKPGTIQQLPDATRAKAASAFYDALLDPANAQSVPQTHILPLQYANSVDPTLAGLK